MPISDQQRNLYGANLMSQEDELAARANPFGYVPGTNFTDIPDDVYYNRPKAKGLFSGDTAVSRAADQMLNTFSGGFAGDRSPNAPPMRASDILAGLVGFVPTIPLSLTDNVMKTFQQIDMDKQFSNQYFSNQEISDEMNKPTKFNEGYFK
jgi:hypothetical protein